MTISAITFYTQRNGSMATNFPKLLKFFFFDIQPFLKNTQIMYGVYYFCTTEIFLDNSRCLLYFWEFSLRAPAYFLSTDSLVGFVISMKIYENVHIIIIRYRPINKLDGVAVKLNSRQTIRWILNYYWNYSRGDTASMRSEIWRGTVTYMIHNGAFLHTKIW